MKKLSEQPFFRPSGHWLAVVLFGAVMILSSARGQSLTPGVDENTVAFWPFDEPEYVNMTLTDASPNHYDLRLRLGGRLTPGKYGNALQILGQELPACMYAEVGAQHMVPDITTRAVDAPTSILQTLAGPDWTWEFWLKLEQTPQSEVALMHLAVPSDPDDDHLNRLYMALAPSASAVVLRDWGTSASGTHLSLPMTKSITDGGWYHLAITKSGQPTTYRLFVDGIQQSPAQTIPPGAPGLDQGNIDYSRGLIGINYDRANFVEAQHAFVDHFFNFDYGTSRDKAWSERWRGSIKGPVSGCWSLGEETPRSRRPWKSGAMEPRSLFLTGGRPSLIRLSIGSVPISKTDSKQERSRPSCPAGFLPSNPPESKSNTRGGLLLSLMTSFLH